MQPKHVRASRILGIWIYYCICLFDIYYITWHGRRMELLSIKQGHEIDTAVWNGAVRKLSIDDRLLSGRLEVTRRRQNIPIKNHLRKQKSKYQELKQEITSMKKIKFRLGLRWYIYFLKFCKGTEWEGIREGIRGYKKDSEILRLMNTVPPGS